MPVERFENVPRLPKRRADAHKGDFGTALIVGGGRGMGGAAALAGEGALRSGAGRVRIASAREVQPTVATFDPCYMAYPLPDLDGLIDFPACLGDLERLIEGSDVVACGPGLGRSDRLAELVRWLVRDVEEPLVLDADALANLVGHVDLLKAIRRPVVLTPHPGEFAKLTGRSTAEVQGDREARAVELARTSDHLVVVLKGARTIVTDGTRVFVNTTGNPGMATGGSGDVLCGVVTALLGQGLAPFEAAVLAAHVHGLAGDIARDDHGEVGMTAGDLVDALPDVFEHLGRD